MFNFWHIFLLFFPLYKCTFMIVTDSILLLAKLGVALHPKSARPPHGCSLAYLSNCLPLDKMVTSQFRLLQTAQQTTSLVTHLFRSF